MRCKSGLVLDKGAPVKTTQHFDMGKANPNFIDGNGRKWPGGAVYTQGALLTAAGWAATWLALRALYLNGSGVVGLTSFCGVCGRRQHERSPLPACV